MCTSYTYPETNLNSAREKRMQPETQRYLANYPLAHSGTAITHAENDHVLSSSSPHASKYFPIAKKTEQSAADDKENPSFETTPTCSGKRSQTKLKNLEISQFTSSSSSKSDESETVSIVALQFSPSLSFATTYSSDGNNVKLQDKNCPSNPDSIAQEIDYNLELPLLTNTENEEFLKKHSQMPCEFITVHSKRLNPLMPFQKRISISNNTTNASNSTPYAKLNANINKKSDSTAEIGYLMRSSVTCYEKENNDFRLERRQSLLSTQESSVTPKNGPHKLRGKSFLSNKKENPDMQTPFLKLESVYNMDALNGQPTYVQLSPHEKLPEKFGGNKKDMVSNTKSTKFSEPSTNILENEHTQKNVQKTRFHSSSQDKEVAQKAKTNNHVRSIIFSNLSSIKIKHAIQTKSISTSSREKIDEHLKRNKRSNDPVSFFMNTNLREVSNFLSSHGASVSLKESKIESPPSECWKQGNMKQFYNAKRHDKVHSKRERVLPFPHCNKTNKEVPHEFCLSKSMESTKPKSNSKVDSASIITNSATDPICSTESVRLSKSSLRTATSTSNKFSQRSDNQKSKKDILFAGRNLHHSTRKARKNRRTKKGWTVKPLVHPEELSSLNGFTGARSSRGTGLKINIKDKTFDSEPNCSTSNCNYVTYETDDGESISGSFEQRKVKKIKNSLFSKPKHFTNKSRNLANKIPFMKMKHNTSLKRLSQKVRISTKAKREFSTSTNNVIADFLIQSANHMDCARLLHQSESNKVTRTRKKHVSKINENLLPDDCSTEELNTKLSQLSKIICSRSKFKTLRQKTKQRIDVADVNVTKRKNSIVDNILVARNKMKSITSSKLQFKKRVHLPHFPRQKGKSLYFV